MASLDLLQSESLTAVGNARDVHGARLAAAARSHFCTRFRLRFSDFLIREVLNFRISPLITVTRLAESARTPYSEWAGRAGISNRAQLPKDL